MVKRSVELLNRSKSEGGWIEIYSHQSVSTQTAMKFSVFRPPRIKSKNPVLFWLSGLTCTHENFIQKAGAQKYLAEKGMFLIAPDTSPRGAGVKGEDDSWEFGTGAGFYLNATESGWSRHYRMYDYVVDELHDLILENFPVDSSRFGISGHSMGGHGALVLGLRNPEIFKSISAFSPICAPSRCPWGKNAFSRYLGSNETAWAEYDSSSLVSKSKFSNEILIDQGEEDEYLKAGQLMPEEFEKGSQKSGQKLNLRMQKGYDHSYYFVSSFIRDHIEFHEKQLT